MQVTGRDNMGCLHLIAVPIGNLGELTPLAREILHVTGTIFCEDTRTTRKLLNLLNIWNNQELISLNRFNESGMIDLVCDKLSRGDCCLVSDAGYPVISDPGYFLVSELRRRGSRIRVINGPCALIHAIVGSGVDSRRIFFANFLTKKYVSRKSELELFKSILPEATIVYYESKNFLLRGLEILQEVFGDIRICVARELSKVNETFYFDNLSILRESIELRGEFVVIIPRMSPVVEDLPTLDSILEEINAQMGLKTHRLKQLCKNYANGNFRASELYSKYVERYRN